MTDVSAEVARLKDRYEACFGCGAANPIGMHLEGFESDGGAVRAAFRPRPEYRGFDGILHGGIVAAALDEIMGWATILLAGTMAVTAKLELRYRNPAPADARYVLEARVAETRGSRLVLEAECRAGEVVVAEARGLFLATEPV